MSAPDRRRQDFFDSFMYSHQLLTFLFPEEVKHSSQPYHLIRSTLAILRKQGFDFSQRTPP